MSKEMKPTIRSILRRIKDDNIQFMDLKFVDLFGKMHHLTMTADLLDEGSFVKGFAFDGSSVQGFQSIDKSDMLLRPDPESVFFDPFFEDPTLSVFCDIIDPDDERSYPRDPRGIAKRAERLLSSLGIADTAYFGPELEFFIFDDVSYDQDSQHGFYNLNNSSAFWSIGEKNHGNIANRKRAYMATPPIDKYNNIRSKITQVLNSVGLETELHHHEVGASGQSEIGFKFGPLLHQADSAIKYKYVVRNVLDRYNKTVTFMPKPILHENGSGMHVNMSLSKKGVNLMYEPNRYADLSELAVHFIGGILKHAPSLCAICNPSTNSYRRLVPGFEAPMNLVYSQRNRSACIRIPTGGSGPKTKRVEYRTPDPSANPYLAFASILLAGIDGIVNKIDPGPPVDQDIYKFAASPEGAKLQRTPFSLADSLIALENDHDYLIKDGVFSKNFIETWINYKRKNELEYINLRPHPGEFLLYFNV
jgi:glutamine synthetase